MSDYMVCPVCQQNDWQVIAVRDFKKSDSDTLDKYSQNMYHFMFEIWHPGKSVITFKNLYCSGCGFVSLFPRPDNNLLHDFFQKRHVENLKDLFQTENNEPIVAYHPKTDKDIAFRRSKILYNYIDRNHGLQAVRRVLDYSGFDGNLMRMFIDNGKECFLTDFCPITIPGVTRLGITADDLKPDEKFDLIICSHIMEHVVNPKETLQQLLSHLSDSGILYIEVPMEIWKRPPLLKQTEPITHLNFFTPNSLRNLFAAGGASVDKCELTEFLHTDGSWIPGIRCLGRKKDANITHSPKYKPDGVKFLKPGLTTYLKYYLHNTRKLKAELNKKIKK